MLPKVLTQQSAYSCDPYNMQSMLQVDEEVGAEEGQPQLRISEHQAGASSLQKDSLSSELASSEQKQGPPKLDLYREAGIYKAPHMWAGYIPSPAGAMDIPLFRSPVSSPQGNRKQSYSQDNQQQHSHRFDYDHGYDYPARRRVDLNAAHPSCQQQHEYDTFEVGPPGCTPGFQSNGRLSGGVGLSSSPLAAEQQREESDNGMRPPGFPAGPRRSGWGPKPSSSGAASEQHVDGMRPPGFPANPNRGMGMPATQSERQLQRHEEPFSSAPQRMQQQRQNGQRGKHKRSDTVLSDTVMKASYFYGRPMGRVKPTYAL